MYLTREQKDILRAFWKNHGGNQFSFPNPDYDGESSSAADLNVIFVAEPTYVRAGFGWNVGLQFIEVP